MTAHNKFERGSRISIRAIHAWRGRTGTVVQVPGDVLNPEHTDQPSSTYTVTFDGHEGVFAGIAESDLQSALTTMTTQCPEV